MMRLRYFTFFFTSLLILFNQRANSQDHYLNPMPEAPISLSANFAEARPNHFHAGIDIKTGGVEGRKVVAIKDGYISRIAYKPYGYGRVLYLCHNDGTTSVYAHLSKFIPKLETYYRKMRYQAKDNSLDAFPEKGLFTFKAGEQIALSGNSGSSGGPHLHFEIRDNATQEALNILSEGFYDITDNINPLIVALHFFAVDTIDGVAVEKKIRTFKPAKLSDGVYGFASTLKLPCKGYFVLETTDRKDGTLNTMGVYNISEYIDGDLSYQLSLDRVNFSQTRAVNAITNFGMQKTSRNEMFRLSKKQNCIFKGLRKTQRNGIIDPEVDTQIRIEVMDDNANLSTLEFAVDLDEMAVAPDMTPKACAHKVLCRKQQVVEVEDFTARFEDNSLFDSKYVEIEKLDTTGFGVKTLSDIYRIDNDSIAYFGGVNISISSDVAGEKGVIMAKYTPRIKKLSYAGGKSDGKKVSMLTTTGGDFCLVKDTIAPLITPVFPKNFSWAQSNSIRFKLSDNFSGVPSYTMSIDGKFAILEYVLRQGSVVHYFDDETFGTDKEHKLILTISDGAGNKTVYTKTYRR